MAADETTDTRKDEMNERRTPWIAIAGLMVAMLALGTALLAAARAGDHTADGGMNGMPMSGMGDGMSMGGMGGMGGMSSGGQGMMEHMAPVPTDGVEDAAVTRGGQRLAHRVEGDVWVFELVATPVRWEILPGQRVVAWTYNGMVPGPEIRVPYGQRVRVVVKNQLPDETTVHWHGIDVPNAMDGVPGVTQDPIAPGGTFTYEFEARPAGGGPAGGTFLYHSHVQEDRQFALGLSGTFVIEPTTAPRPAVERTIVIQEWNLNASTGETRPAMEMMGLQPNFFTLNGKSYPATETVNLKRGQRALFRLVGAGSQSHPMHLHGTSFRVVAKDGHPLASPFEADVIQVGSGERYDIEFTADRPGRWVFHCHIGHHLTNDGDEPGGLLMVVNVT